MRFVDIPGTELTVSCVCFGTASFGDRIEKAAAFRLLDIWRDFGGSFIDTANVYPRWATGENTGELLIGEYIASRGCAQSLTVGTKGGHYELANPEVNRTSRECVRADIEQSLAALRLECIPLYWLHRDDSSRPAGEIVEFCEELRREGKLTNYGASNWTHTRVEEAQSYARAHGCRGFCAVQNRFAAMKPKSEGDKTIVGTSEEMLAWHCHTGVPAIPFTSTAGGCMERAAAGSWPERYDTAANRDRFAILRRYASEHGLNMTDMAIAYHTSRSFCDIPIASTGDEKHLQTLIKASEVRLPPELLAECDAVR